MLKTVMKTTICLLVTVSSGIAVAQPQKGKIIHGAEFYILEAQNGKKWAAEDNELDAKLAALEKKDGRPPNIIHILFDDVAFGDIGIPAIQKVRGFETPNLNKMAREGILFSRMYTEVGCTPSRL